MSPALHVSEALLIAEGGSGLLYQDLAQGGPDEAAMCPGLLLGRGCLGFINL